jgi:hypothetical protein
MMIDPGLQIEDYARRLAGDLGVKDFVYHPVQIRKGSATREISDGLLVAGNRGLILQVKSRHPDAAHQDTPEKATSWCAKNAAAAVRQADGTRKSLERGSVTARSLRGFERILPDASQWPAVVIIDHPVAASMEFPATPNTVYISLSDWRNLHSWLRSTWGVITYVHRALDSNLHVRLGNEIDRYAALLSADLSALGSPTSFPSLAMSRLEGTQALDASLFEDLIERVADHEGATGWDPQQYLWIIEELDQIPPIARVRIGGKMRQSFLAMRDAKSRRSFMVWDPTHPRTRFAFLYDHDESDDRPEGWFIARVATYGLLRHNQALAAGAATTSATLAIGLLHHPDHGNRYAFFYIAEADLALPKGFQCALEDEFGVYDGKSIYSRSQTMHTNLP